MCAYIYHIFTHSFLFLKTIILYIPVRHHCARFYLKVNKEKWRRYMLLQFTELAILQNKGLLCGLIHLSGTKKEVLVFTSLVVFGKMQNLLSSARTLLVFYLRTYFLSLGEMWVPSEQLSHNISLCFVRQKNTCTYITMLYVLYLS